MLSAQFLVSCSRPSHPSHQVVLEPPGSRKMKSTLASKHSDRVSPHLTNGVVDPSLYRQSLTSIHSDAVKQTIASLDVNPLLGTPPPPISASEASLTRLQRSTLSQLRSGQCHLLNDYQVLTGRGPSALCPECLHRRHTVPHLFNCDATPSDLTLVDMWINPILVKTFLVTLPAFSSLEPTEPPPPPEPPP